MDMVKQVGNVLSPKLVMNMVKNNQSFSLPFMSFRVRKNISSGHY